MSLSGNPPQLCQNSHSVMETDFNNLQNHLHTYSPAAPAFRPARTWAETVNVPPTPMTPSISVYSARKDPYLTPGYTPIDEFTTLRGQQAGAILTVKRALKQEQFRPVIAKVGDYVSIIKYHDAVQVEVKNLRTGMTGVINWEDLLPIPHDGRCECAPGTCRCVYETFDAFCMRCSHHSWKSMNFLYSEEKNRMHGMDDDFFNPVASFEHSNFLDAYPLAVQPSTFLNPFTFPNESAFSNPTQTFSAPPVPTGSTPGSTHTPSVVPTQVANPMTPAGQVPGAVLRIKQVPHYPIEFGPVLETEVGDCVTYLNTPGGGWGKVKAKNIRTGKEGFLRWNAFRAVNTRNTCACMDRYCYCEYEDFDKSEEYCGAKVDESG